MQLARKKRVLWGVLALAGLTFFALGFIGFDAGSLKEKIVAAVWEKKARKLEIKGDLRLKILPRLAVEMDNARLSGPNGEGEFLEIGQLRGGLQILPLLGGRFIVEQIEVRDFVLFAEQNEDGSTNFDDLFAREEETDSKPLDLAIGKIAFAGGRLSWHELASGQRFILEDFYLNSDLLGMKAQGNLEMGGKVTGAPLEGLLVSFKSGYRIEGEAKTLHLNEADLTLASKEQKLRWRARELTADWGALLLTIAGMKLEGEMGKLTAVLAVDELNLGQESGAVQGGSLRFTLQADESASFSLEAKLPALQGEGGNWHGEPLEASLAGKWQESELTGKIVLPLTLQRHAGGMRIGADGLTLEAKAAGGGLKEALDGSLYGSFALLLPEGTSSGKIELLAGESRLDLDWQTTMPPALVFRASLNKLNVDRYWNMAGSSEEKTDNGEEASSFALPFALDGVLRVGELVVNGMRVENLASRIVWEDGRLALGAEAKEGTEQKSVAPLR